MWKWRSIFFSHYDSRHCCRCFCCCWLLLLLCYYFRCCGCLWLSRSHSIIGTIHRKLSDIYTKHIYNTFNIFALSLTFTRISSAKKASNYTLCVLLQHDSIHFLSLSLPHFSRFLAVVSTT